MEESLSLLESADGLIAEINHKQPGVTLEVGFAYALSKPIILIRQQGTEGSKTLEGVADILIEYSGEKPLSGTLSEQLQNLEQGKLPKKEIRKEVRTDLLVESIQEEARRIATEEEFKNTEYTFEQTAYLMNLLTLELLYKIEFAHQDRENGLLRGFTNPYTNPIAEEIRKSFSDSMEIIFEAQNRIFQNLNEINTQ